MVRTARRSLTAVAAVAALLTLGVVTPAGYVWFAFAGAAISVALAAVTDMVLLTTTPWSTSSASGRSARSRGAGSTSPLNGQPLVVPRDRRLVHA